jgi:hypothetical protein
MKYRLREDIRAIHNSPISGAKIVVISAGSELQIEDEPTPEGRSQVVWQGLRLTVQMVDLKTRADVLE